MKKLELYKAHKIVETTLKNGGYSFNEYHSGFMVSLEGSERKIRIRDNSISDIAYQIQAFFERYKTVNTWFDDGTIYLDVSVNIKDRNDALRFAQENNQLAIYDCYTGEAITV